MRRSRALWAFSSFSLDEQLGAHILQSEYGLTPFYDFLLNGTGKIIKPI
jgi:hypothetical protein